MLRSCICLGFFSDTGFLNFSLLSSHTECGHEAASLTVNLQLQIVIPYLNRNLGVLSARQNKRGSKESDFKLGTRAQQKTALWFFHLQSFHVALELDCNRHRDRIVLMSVFGIVSPVVDGALLLQLIKSHPIVKSEDLAISRLADENMLEGR